MEDGLDNLTLGILAHVDAGKTTLTESLLYTAGQLREAGRVDSGDTFLDTHELERERGITIFSKQAVFMSGNTRVTLLDTPGHTDFSAEMERTLQVLDYAVLVISGADGVQGHTETLWRLLYHYQIPVFLFVNKMDQPGTEKEALLAEIKDRLSSSAVDFSDVKSQEFAESVALCDETLLEAYLETGVLEASCLPVLIRQRKLYPCFFGSALKIQGVKELFDALGTYTESPAYPEELGAKVFKISRDEKGNRLTFVKITGGVLRPRMELWDDRNGWREKINQIRLYSGERFEALGEAEAGMVCALTGLTETFPGEGIGNEIQSGKPVTAPVLTYRLLFPDDCEPAALLPKLRMLEEENPELHIAWKEELQEIQVQVLGDVQMEVLQRLAADRFGVDISFDVGSIVYKETISSAVEGIGHYEPLRHYAEVHLKMEPGKPGSGFQIATECSGDVLDRNWQRLIAAHLLEREHCGVLTGAPLTDVKVTLVSGRAHLKHTEGGDFRQATYRAVRQGLMQAENVLLEPYYKFRLEVPETAVGRAMTDIERMAGTFSVEQNTGGAHGNGGISVLTGEVPAVNMQGYAREVNAYAKGRGKLSCSLLGYRPCHNAEEVIAQSGYDPERDVENPAGSVFCAHGAGFYVKWDEVGQYAHIDTVKINSGNSASQDVPMPGKEYAAAERAAGGAEDGDGTGAGGEDWMDTDEVDQILNRASNANKNENKNPRRRVAEKRVRARAPSSAAAGERKIRRSRDDYLLVDGYNIIFSWKELMELSKRDIGSARGKLLDIMCNYQGFKNIRVIVVFDAYRVQNHRTELLDYHNIHVVYTREAETADQYIEKFAHDNAGKYNITVATSDGLEQIIIRGEGCRLWSARELEAEIANANEGIKEYLDG